MRRTHIDGPLAVSSSWLLVVSSMLLQTGEAGVLLHWRAYTNANNLFLDEA